MAGRVAAFPGTAPTPKLGVITSVESSLLTLGKFPRFNPDELAARRGLKIYAQMRLDEQVKAVTQFRRDAIISRGWQFTFADETLLSEDEQALRILVFTQIAKRVRGGFNEVLRSLARGSDDGFSLLEKIYVKLDVAGKKVIGLSDLIFRSPSDFRFYTDEYGELVRFTMAVSGRELDLDHDKFVHYVEEPNEDPYYGRSQLRAAYRSWFMKDVLMKLQTMSAEKYGGFLLVTGDASAPEISAQSPEGVALAEMLRDVKTLSGVKLPNGLSGTLVFPPAGSDPFKDKIEYHDLAIAKSVLVPNLLGLSHTGQTGAFAQSQTQLEAFYWTLMTTGNAYTQCLNEQLFQPLGIANWNDGEYPYLCFKPFSMERLKWMLETVSTLATGKALVLTEKDEAWMRKLLEMPERSAEDKLLVTPVDQAAMANAQQTLDQGAQLGQAKLDIQAAANDASAARQQARYAQERTTELRGALDALTAAVQLNSTRDAPVPAAAKASLEPDQERQPTLRYSLAKAQERVAFAVIDQRSMAIVAEGARRLAVALAASVNRLLNSPEMNDGRFADIMNVELGSADIGRLKSIAKDAVTQGFYVGQQQARSELNRARSNTDLPVAQFADVRRQAADYLEAKGFRMAADVSDATRKYIQQELENAIKYGYGGSQTRNAVWARLAGKGFVSVDDIGDFSPAEMEQVATALGLASAEDRAGRAYLDTLVRTNTFDALNEARFAEFSDPALADFIVALRYSAILDDRTTEICNELNDDVWVTDSPMWDTYRPPNHFNCRSLLVPITVVDGWDGTESDQPIAQPQDGFGGGT